MSVVVTKLAEIALINLYFAEADLIAAGDSPEQREQIRKHIREAEVCLKIIAPDFDGPSESDDAEVAA